MIPQYNYALFEEETLNYLYNSFEKVGLDKECVNKIFVWLKTAPGWTTIRLNKHLYSNNDLALTLLQDHIKKDFNDEQIEYMPKIEVLNDLINDCFILKLNKIDKLSNNSITVKSNKMVIVDMKCGQAVLRGADVFIPGILAMTHDINKNDYVSIYADRCGKCLRGSNPNSYTYKNELIFIGIGISAIERKDVFKERIVSGLGIKLARFQNDCYSPSFNGLDKRYFYLQNLPSIICAYILQPEAHQTILDICAAPGGKTTHLAFLTNNQAKIIAFDKIESKIRTMRDLCKLMNFTSIECFQQDSTKIDLFLDFEKYKPESFDRVLCDAPCSALGQRPLLFNEITVSHLQSYISYQRLILSNAIKLLKPGGFLLYCTCTITVEENEAQVLWILNTFSNMNLVSQEPYHIGGRGLPHKGLNQDQLNLLQRFGPYSQTGIEIEKSVYNDTIGFFIAKFTKH